jgi:hypothetical protein
MTEIQFGKDRYQEISSMCYWCWENFGDGGYLAPHARWTLEQAFGNSFFRFKDDKDATFFALRWL